MAKVESDARRADFRIVLLLGHHEADLRPDLRQHVLGQVAAAEEDPHHVLEEDQPRGPLAKQLVFGGVKRVDVAIQTEAGDLARHHEIGHCAVAGLGWLGKRGLAGRTGRPAVHGHLKRCGRAVHAQRGAQPVASQRLRYVGEEQSSADCVRRRHRRLVALSTAALTHRGRSVSAGGPRRLVVGGRRQTPAGRGRTQVEGL